MKFHFLTKAHAVHGRRGLSLVEFMVAMAIASIIFAAVSSLSLFSARSFVAMGNYAELDAASQNALDVMSREIRQTKSLTTFQTNILVFLDSDDTPLMYLYHPGTSQLTRHKGGVATVLLKQCDYLRFSMSQRNPSNGFSFYPATNVSVAKLIDVSWRCSRKILGAKVNTESVQTAKIVIRN